MSKSLLRRVAFILYPMSQLALVATSIVWIVNLQLPTGRLWVVALLAVACIPVDYQLFREVRKTQEADIVRERVRMLKEQERVQAAYRERIAADMESILELRRRVADEVDQAARQLRERQGGGAQERLAHAVDIMGQSAYRLCAHRSVDAVATMKLKACKEAGVRADFALEMPETVGIPAVELCAVVANLMDNGLAAALRARDEGARREGASADGQGKSAPADASMGAPENACPFVSLRSRVHHRQLIIEACNSIGEADRRAWEQKMPRRRAAHRRSWDEQHGWGLSIVSGIASRHAGELQCAVEGDTFRATVLLCLPAARTDSEKAQDA